MFSTWKNLVISFAALQPLLLPQVVTVPPAAARALESGAEELRRVGAMPGMTAARVAEVVGHGHAAAFRRRTSGGR